MGLSLFEAGSTVVMEERWRGLLWSAVPHTVVSSTAQRLITYVPAGTVSVLATNRDLPGTEGLTREQRKLLALRTCRARAGEHAEWPDKLYVYRPDRWARINLGWDPDTGGFLGWYVNFELPPRPTDLGLGSKDLVLDLWVNPDRSWMWKDQDDYRTALDEGILDPAIREPIQHEATSVLQELAAHTGPFAHTLRQHHSPHPVPTPRLPESYGWQGREWKLPPGRQVT